MKDLRASRWSPSGRTVIALVAAGLCWSAPHGARATGPAPSPTTAPADPAAADASPATATPKSEPAPAQPTPPKVTAPRPDANTMAKSASDGEGPSTIEGIPGSAFALPVADRLDPYGPRPDGVPRLSRDQVIGYALQNPLVQSAKQQVVAMKAQVRKAKWAWLPVIEATATLTPGANIACNDIMLDVVDDQGQPIAGNAGLQEFQVCAPAGNDDLDLQTVQGYFQQLSRAGVRVAFDANAVFPIFTFGKIRNLKRLAKAGVALKKLEVLQYQQETIKLVLQAHTALLLARESQIILRDAKQVVDKAKRRVEADLGGGGEDWDSDPDEESDRDPNDLIKVELAEIDVEQKMRAALRAEALALAALWDLAGSAAPVGFDIQEDTLTAWSIDGGLRPLAEYRELAIQERPEAHMARAAVEARQAQEKLARAAFLPDLGLAVGVGFAVSNAVDRDMNRLYYQDPFNYSRVTAALALRWRWDFHNSTFDLQKARAELSAQEYQQKAAELLLGQDVSNAYQDVVEADHRIALAERATELTWQLVVSLEQRDMVGGGDAETLIRALNDWYKKRFAEAEAVHAHNEAVAALSRAVGTSLIAPPGPSASASMEASEGSKGAEESSQAP